MGNSLRCCLACVLPCGALDLIRVVHITGHVDEYSRPISAAEILRSNPNHVLSKPSSTASGVRRVVVVSPDSDLKRGSIYFLVPNTAISETKQTKKVAVKDEVVGVIPADMFVAGTLPEKKHGDRRRRSVRVGVWRPHLQSIKEVAAEERWC